MTDREKLEQAIAALEAQRAVLGDVAVDAAIAGLREKLRDSAPTARPSKGWQGERKLVTVMFADISGFTAMSETMDPEAVRALMNACFECLVPVIKKYDGTIDKFIGDEIMALFGAPLAHENDPERALRAAIEMFAALEAFNAARGAGLGLHFGINTGLVIAGDIGAQARQEYSVLGDAVNLAKRLEDVSERGEILVGADTFRATAPLFDFDALAPLKVKGKAEPVQIYRLRGAKARPGSVRGLESHGLHAPLVGRRQELHTLLTAVEQLHTGRGGVVFLVGEAGMGKSRLLAEARQQAARADMLWLEGQALSLGQTIGYWLFQGLLRQWAGITEKDSEATAWTKLELRVTELTPDHVAEFLPYLASLLALKVRAAYAERVKYLDGEAMGRQIFLTMRRFFERLAQTRPLVLVCEDLHWADASSGHLLEHLLPLIAQTPLLLCIVSRPEQSALLATLQDRAAQDYQDYTTMLHLTPLAPADSLALVCHLLDLDALPAHLRATILRKAEGNPFFVEEIIRALVDAGAIAREPGSGRWRVTARAEQVTIPDTVQGLVMARVDRLQDEVKHVLGVAAVIGRSFLYRVLHALWQAEQDLDQHLDILQQIELIREQRQVPELEYMFKHALVHEATYASLLRERRRALHAQVGQCIETLFADRLEEFYSVLAHHYTQAEDWEKAQAYLFQAADQAGSLAADAEALQHYQQALAAYERVFGDRWDPKQQALLESRLGEVLYRKGQYKQAWEHLQKSLICLQSPFPTSRWGVYSAIARQILQQISHRLLPNVFLSKTSPDPNVEERCHIYEIIAWMSYITGNRPHYFLSSISGLNMSERNAFLLGICRGQAGLGAMGDFIGQFQIATHYHHNATSLAEKLQNPLAVGVAYVALAYHQYCLNTWQEAQMHYQKAQDAFWRVGNLREWGLATMLSARLSCVMGQFKVSIEQSQKVAMLGQDSSDRQMLAWGLQTQGYAELHIGLHNEAIQHLQEAIDLHRAMQGRIHLVMAISDLAECYLRQEMLEKSLDLLKEAGQIIDTHNLRESGTVWCLNTFAETYLLAATLARTENEIADWLHQAKRACKITLKHSRTFNVGLPKACRLQGNHAWLTHKPKLAQKWWQESLEVAAEMGARYEVGMTHLEMGRYLRDRVHLEQARDSFAELGAKWDWAQAQALLEQ